MFEKLYEIKLHKLKNGKIVVVCSWLENINSFTYLNELKGEWVVMFGGRRIDMIFDMYRINGRFESRFAKIHFNGKEFVPLTFKLLSVEDIDKEVLKKQNIFFQIYE